MLQRFRSQHSQSGPVPIADLVGRAFRSGALIPFLVIAILFAVTVPVATIGEQAEEGESYGAVLQGVISDRTALFVDKAQTVARLVGSSSGGVTTEERLAQLVATNSSIESAVVSDRLGSPLAEAHKRSTDGGAGVHGEAIVWIRNQAGPYLSPPTADSHFGGQSIVIAVPVESPTGQLKGMLQMHVSTDWMIEAIQRTNRSLEVDTFLVDSAGTVIAHEDEWRVLANQSITGLNSGLADGPDGSKVIAGFVPVPEWEGQVLVATTWPVSVILINVALGMIPVAIVLVAYVATVRARRKLVSSVVEPVLRLEEAIESYGPGNFGVRAGPTGVEEIDVVAVMFNETANRIDSLVESLRESNAQLEDFASIAAHDLQEPLRKVRSFGDMLERSSRDKLGDEGIRYLERMQDGAGRMQQLIDDLLVYSRLTTRAAPFELVDLNETVGRVLSDLDFALAEAETQVEVDRLPLINGEPTQIYQLIQNLVSNAIKFRKPDVPHRITISVEHTGNRKAMITIADNGIGFSDEYSEQVFKIFERLHGRSSYSGTGIGLALCRKIVERHDGTITARGADGEGAAFLITLPVSERELAHV